MTEPKKTKTPAKPRTAAARKKPSPNNLTVMPPPRDQVALLAYQLWMQRGCPIGNADQDWLHAEQQLLQGQAS